jgi:large subunit ribosomal protein L13
MRTVVVNHNEIGREWYVVDAANMVLGRLASRVARVLSGKNKPAFSPNQDHGDYVIVINTDKVRVTGRKAEKKTYFSHSTKPGGEKIRPFRVQMEKDSTKVLREAVHGMLPKNALGRAMIRKLHMYRTEVHPHAAQNPKALELK